MRRMRAAPRLAVALLLPALLSPAPAAAVAAPRVALHARFHPDRLGASTTIHFAFAISEPAPLRSMALRLPPGMGFASTSLGIEACQPELLAQDGPAACPADSRLGRGTALAAVPAQTTVEEKTKVTAFMGPAPAGAGQRMSVLFSVDGRWPVQRQIVLESRVSEMGSPRGATLATEVPPLSVWPEGPDIGLMRFHSTIGPEGLTYHRRLGGKTISFKPRGITVPEHCPHGAFRVSATFSWWGVEGSQTAQTQVRCPHDPPRGHQRAGRSAHHRGRAATHSHHSHRGRRRSA